MHLKKALLPVLIAHAYAVSAFAQTPVPAPPPAEPPATTPADPAPPPVPNAPPKRGQPDAILPGVEVTGSRGNATDERRNSTASRIIIDRATIEQYGDSNLGDVLRRMPGVTQGGRPGRGGDIRMRGMGAGFTQILINGERIPPGFSVEQITPEQVERIEILRAPTAETGARAIAGTINIILREPLRQLSNEIRASVQTERGEPQVNASWNHNGVLSETGTYNFTVSGGHTEQLTDTATRTLYTNTATGETELDQTGFSQSKDERSNLFISSRFQWRLGQGEQFSIQPFLVRNEFSNRTTGSLTQAIGLVPASYASFLSKSSGDFTVGRINTQLMKKLTDDTRAELRASAGRFSSDSEGTRTQFDNAGQTTLTQNTSNSVRDQSWNVFGKLTHSLDGNHTIVGGAEIENVKRTETPLTLLNGVRQLADFGSELNVSTNRNAVFIQDEWDPAKDWSAYLGLRWESIETKSDSAGTPIQNKSSVVTPLAQAVWRFDAPRRDQLRFALTQSYRAPTTQQLVGRPSLNTQDPVPGANQGTTPDRAGNPDLKPELATGVDIAYEHYFKSGGIFSASVFQRQIKDLIRNVTTLENVSWATSPRFVNRPQNLGDVVTRGVEFDAKFQLSELIEGAAPVNFKLNLSVFDSKVEQVPGPYNRIDQQPRATGNFGVDYRFRGTPFTLGGNLNWTPAYTTQISAEQVQKLNTKRVFDMFALYTVNPTTRVRFTLSNIAPADSITESSISTGDQVQSTISNGRTDVNASLRLEVKI